MIPERVERGARLLDERVPGWVEKIDLDHLRIDNCYYCIIGQVFEEFTKKIIEDLGLSFDDDEDCLHGFNSMSLSGELDCCPRELEKEWVKLIQQRRSR